MKKYLKICAVIVLSIITIFTDGLAQNSRNWDNQIYLGNKIAFGENRWKFSGELQTRLEDNFQQLDNWYLEFVGNYLASDNIEIVPDFRYTIKPDKIEYRPGIGLLLKKTTSFMQIVNQNKWQVDIDSHGKIGNAFREVIFSNHAVNDHLIATLVAGFIYRWWPDWNGFQYIRVGPGVSYIFDDQHILNFSYFVGVENNTKKWMWAGIPMIQLVINISKKENYKYVPAYYFDF